MVFARRRDGAIERLDPQAAYRTLGEIVSAAAA
jgi:hypothetical protein